MNRWAAGIASAFVARPLQSAETTPDSKSADPMKQVGITTSSMDGHVSAHAEQGKIALVDLPKVMQD